MFWLVSGWNSPAQRTEVDLDHVLRWVREMRIAFFESIDPPTLRRLCRHFQLLEYGANRTGTFSYFALHE